MKEKVWFQKQEAFLNIIEALHNTIIWADEENAVNFPYPLPTVSKEKLHELRSNQDNAMKGLRESLINSSCLRKTVSMLLISLDLGIRRDDDKQISQTFP